MPQDISPSRVDSDETFGHYGASSRGHDADRALAELGVVKPECLVRAFLHDRWGKASE